MVSPIIRGKSYVGEMGKSMKAGEFAVAQRSVVVKSPHDESCEGNCLHVINGHTLNGHTLRCRLGYTRFMPSFRRIVRINSWLVVLLLLPGCNSLNPLC